MQFSQPCWQTFSLGKKVFRSLPVNDRKKDFSKASCQFSSERFNDFLYTWIVHLQPRQKVSARSPKFISYFFANDEVMNLLQQTVSTQKDPMITYNGILTTLQRKFVEEAENFWLNLRNSWKNQNHSVNTFYQFFWKPQMFISTCRMQVLPPRWKNFARWPKSFPSISKNNEENVEVFQKLLEKTFFSKVFPWLRTIQFWQPFRERFASRLQTFPLISEKNQKEFIISCKIVFLT